MDRGAHLLHMNDITVVASRFTCGYACHFEEGVTQDGQKVEYFHCTGC